ncbi:hypothetical protein [Halococcus agarilyticus]|uniref:hypothetical protein n=1 Tax=Halococcus agarilyticus TaxID=1232219 RepID=UPI0006780A0B|nr:hypothetical protein [Halococcus agarilyticus]
MSERAAATRRWALANAEAHSLDELLEPFVGSFVQRIEPDAMGGFVVDFAPGSESKVSFAFQLAYMSGWIPTDGSFEQRWIRFQNPDRIGEYLGWAALPDPGDELADPPADLNELEEQFGDS